MYRRKVVDARLTATIVNCALLKLSWLTRHFVHVDILSVIIKQRIHVAVAAFSVECELYTKNVIDSS